MSCFDFFIYDIINKIYLKVISMKKFFYEFKTFALKGNMMGIAVGVLIGAAFQGVVTSLTEDILSPIIGLFIRQNFDSLELHVC